MLTGLTTFGGTSGLQADGLNLFGHEFVEPTQVFPLVAVAAVVIFVLCYRMGESPYGRILRAIRDDEEARDLPVAAVRQVKEIRGGKQCRSGSIS